MKRVWFRIQVWFLKRQVDRGLALLRRRLVQAGYPRHVRREVWRALMRRHGDGLTELMD